MSIPNRPGIPPESNSQDSQQHRNTPQLRNPSDEPQGPRNPDDEAKSSVNKPLIIGGSVIIALLLAFLIYTIVSGDDEEKNIVTPAPIVSESPTIVPEETVTPEVTIAPDDSQPVPIPILPDDEQEPPSEQEAPADLSAVTEQQRTTFSEGLEMFDVTRFNEDEGLTYAIQACTLAEDGSTGENILTTVAKSANIDMSDNEQFEDFMELSYTIGVGIGVLCPVHQDVFES